MVETPLKDVSIPRPLIPEALITIDPPVSGVGVNWFRLNPYNGFVLVLGRGEKEKKAIEKEV